MDDKFNLIERSPTVEEYLKLRQAVGWGNVDIEAAKIGLQNSFFSVCAIYKDEVIGCGRVVGDEGLYFLYSRCYCYACLPEARYWQKHYGCLNKLSCFTCSLKCFYWLNGSKRSFEIL